MTSGEHFETAAETSFAFRSQISDIAWPPVPNPWAGGIAAMLYQMEQTQYWPREEIERRQLLQANILLKHARSTTPFYQELYDRKRVPACEIESWSDWQQLPIVSRQMLQEAGDGWHAAQLPKDHGQLMEYYTSGSTGTPLRSVNTTLGLLFKSALVLRHHKWSRENTGSKAAYIQEVGADHINGIRQAKNWEKATENIIETGPAIVMSVSLSPAEQIAHMEKFKPAYLFTYPSVVAAIAKYAGREGIKLPFLKQIGTYGEILEPSIRSLVKEVWGVPVRDGYSAKEVGPIALQCPDNDHYHVQSEALIVEVLDDNGRPCAPGEVGRVVITGLHNFAAPLIRYEIGDFAEMGDACSCGRRLPVLNRILGRQRNMLLYPDGSQRWPSLNEASIVSNSGSDFPDIKQFQIVQHTLDQLEVRIVLSRDFTKSEEALMEDYLKSQLGSHWQISFSYPEIIERGSRGKFEDFISHCQAG